MVAEGEPAPDFELTSDSGGQVKLSDLRGKPIVLYFYPRDDTRTVHAGPKAQRAMHRRQG